MDNAKNKTIELVDFLKGYSMFTIVVFHIVKIIPMDDYLGKLTFFGGTGVHTFILISGFGLSLAWHRTPMRYFEFIKKRFAKIYVPYIFIVTLVAGLSLIVPIYDSSLYSYLGHVLLFKMFDEGIIGSFGDHFWFLSTIFQFYLVFPFLMILYESLKNKKFLILGLIISVLWVFIVLILGNEDLRTWKSFFLQYLWEFALGMVLAGFYHNRKYVVQINNYYVGLVAFLALLLYAFLAIRMGNVGKMINDIPALIGYTLLAIMIY